MLNKSKSCKTQYTVATRLRQVRIARNLTQIQAAQSIYTFCQVLCSYENGRVMPTVHSLLALAELYDVSIDYLVGRTSNKNSHKEETNNAE